MGETNTREGTTPAPGTAAPGRTPPGFRAGMADPTGPALARHILTFDPDSADDHLFTLAARQPTLLPIPWPAGLAPTPFQPPGPPPTRNGPLPACDVLVVTWTVAEAKALADVLTPGVPTSAWTDYRRNFDTVFKPMIRRGAPALHSDRLGIFATTRIGSSTVACVKSDLHLSQDGSKLPVRALWAQMIKEVRPSLVITTGTAGGVGAQTILGDVVVSKTARFDCLRTFKSAPFASTSFTDATPLGATSSQFATAVQTLIPVNATRLPPSPRPPTIVAAGPDSPANVLTTDFFAFDDTTDHWGLRAYDPGSRAVEMGDAVLGLVCEQDLTDPPAWVCVRNASDPQMDGSLPLTEQARDAAGIYEKYGYWTTVGSAIACWALIAG
jgi:hypothetical protein